MDFNGKIIKISGREITIQLDEDFDILTARRISDSEMNVIGEVLDKRSITWPQQKLINALYFDASEALGYPPSWCEDFLKALFSQRIGREKISIAANNMTQVEAGKFIECIIDWFFYLKIPFRYEKYHLASDVSRILFLYLKHRSCFCCGKPNSDYAHYEAVGMGRNRKMIDHSQNRFMCLCREHHNEQHEMGINSFMEKWHIAPIKLSPEQIEEFKIGKNLHKEDSVKSKEA